MTGRGIENFRIRLMLPCRGIGLIEYQALASLVFV